MSACGTAAEAKGVPMKPAALKHLWLELADGSLIITHTQPKVDSRLSAQWSAVGAEAAGGRFVVIIIISGSPVSREQIKNCLHR